MGERTSAVEVGTQGTWSPTPRRSGWQASLRSSQSTRCCTQLPEPWLPPSPICREVFNPKEALSQMTLPARVTSLFRNLEGHQSPGHLTHGHLDRKDAVAFSPTGHSLGTGGRAGTQTSVVLLLWSLWCTAQLETLDCTFKRKRTTGERL